METKLSKSTVGFGLAFAIVSIINGLLVIVKETTAPLKDFMKALTGHHWVTHGIFVILVFLILGYLLTKADLTEKYDGNKLTACVLWSSVIGIVLIFGFYLIH